MIYQISDTHPEIERIQLEWMRSVPAWRKLELLGQLNQAVKELALRGLCLRYPQASQAELNRRLAELMLGQALAETVYGPLECRYAR